MSDTRHYIAIDLGAESGRAMLGTLKENTLEVEAIHRFPNGPLNVGDTLRWDFDRLLAEIKTGIGKCIQAAGAEVAGIGVDSWGVDFGLLDADGRLVEPPYHYRDARTNGMLDEAFKRMQRRELYEHTGIQFMQINSLYQLLAMRLKNDPALAKTHRLTFIADLVSYALCGRLYAEYTLASTSQMMDMRTGGWSEAVLSAMDISQQILPEIVQPSTVVGRLRDDVAREIGCSPLPVIAAASHDTGAAVAAVPAEGEHWAYLSSGTWSLMGVETPNPIITDATYEYSFTNEGGVEGTIRLLKNIVGLWLVQECRRQWQCDGDILSYAALTDMAARARPFAARIDPNHADFLSPGDMPAKINSTLQQAGRQPLSDRGEMVRSVLEALAFTYRETLDRLEEFLGRKIEVLHVVGGGAQNELLNQFAANALNRPIVAGPIEATSIGNVLLQARAVGQIESLQSLRTVVRSSFPIKEYAPQDADLWEEEYQARKAKA